MEGSDDPDCRQTRSKQIEANKKSRAHPVAIPSFLISPNSLLGPSFLRCTLLSLSIFIFSCSYSLFSLLLLSSSPPSNSSRRVLQ